MGTVDLCESTVEFQEQVLLPPPPVAKPKGVYADPFYFGFRVIPGTNYQVQPLTPEDFLDPQEGDHFMQGELHEEDTERVKSIFRLRYQKASNLKVFSDLKFQWGLPGLSEPAPDVAIVRNIQIKNNYRGTFKVLEEGTRPCFVLEVVSPNYVPEDRIKKVELYEKVGIPEYFIIDSRLFGNIVAYEVVGYRLEGGKYAAIPRDERGWVYSQETDVWLGPTPERDSFVVVDGQTGEFLLPGNEKVEIETARADAEAERADAEAAKATAEAERADAEAAKAQAEAARADAESAKAVAEAERADAESAKAQAEAARADAEAAKAQAEAERAAAAERQLAALQAELARLRDGGQE